MDLIRVWSTWLIQGLTVVWLSMLYAAKACPTVCAVRSCAMNASASARVANVRKPGHRLPSCAAAWKLASRSDVVVDRTTGVPALSVAEARRVAVGAKWSAYSSAPLTTKTRERSTPPGCATGALLGAAAGGAAVSPAVTADEEGEAVATRPPPRHRPVTPRAATGRARADRTLSGRTRASFG